MNKKQGWGLLINFGEKDFTQHIRTWEFIVDRLITLLPGHSTTDSLKKTLL